MLGILFYILNRERVSGAILADKFGVSRRTILRDIDTLALAGVPIYAETGSKGGYSINQSYRINEKLIDNSNSEYILLALKSLKDVYGDKKVTETYEKVKHMFSVSDSEKTMEIDFSVINENKYTIEMVSKLKYLIQEKSNITFEYTNSKSKSHYVTIDILHVFYKWYSWYIFGYNTDKKEFRMYKIVRIRNLKQNNELWLQDYDIKKELEKYENAITEKNITIYIEYEKEIQILIEEYFLGEIITEKENTIVSKVTIKDDDFILFSIILGFGNKIKVLAPTSFSLKIQQHLEKTLKIYKNSDI
nr:WYL domain-containing protein [Clostridium sp. CCUG 7971]